MSYLESEISKLKKKGFEIVKKPKTLKYGKTVYLQKKKGGVSGFLGSYDKTYLYFAEGDSNTRNITEFIKDYHKFYGDNEFDAADRGFFLVSGNFDKVDFNNLRNGLLKNNDIKNSIVVRQVESEITKQKTEFQQVKIREKTVEREITRTNISIEKVSFAQVVKTIGSIDFIPCLRENAQFLGILTFLAI